MIKVKFHMDSLKIQEHKKQRENNFSEKTVKLRKKSLWLKKVKREKNP